MTTDPAPTTWRMYAGRRRNGVFCDVGTDPRHPRMHGHTDIVAVDVVEDPDGEHWGWIQHEHRVTGEPGDGTPVMIFEREVMFRMCFPYGVEAEQESGRGRVVRLTITPADTEPTPGPTPDTTREVSQ